MNLELLLRGNDESIIDASWRYRYSYRWDFHTILHGEPGKLTKNRDEWETNVPVVSSLLTSDALKVKAKALWLFGEMGPAFPSSSEDHVHAVAS